MTEKDTSKQEPTRSQKMRDAGITRRPKGWDKEQEPFAEVRLNMTGGNAGLSTHIVQLAEGYYPAGTKLYTTPPQRTWVGLTDEELRKIIDETGFGILMNVWFDGHDGNPKKILQAIEAKLKEKNT